MTTERRIHKHAQGREDLLREASVNPTDFASHFSRRSLLD